MTQHRMMDLFMSMSPSAKVHYDTDSSLGFLRTTSKNPGSTDGLKIEARQKNETTSQHNITNCLRGDGEDHFTESRRCWNVSGSLWHSSTAWISVVAQMKIYMKPRVQLNAQGQHVISNDLQDERDRDEGGR